MGLKKNYIFTLAEQINNVIKFKLSKPLFTVYILVLEEDVFKVFMHQNDQPVLKNSWTLSPGSSDVAFDGRSRLDTNGYSVPNYSFIQSNDEVEIFTSKLRAVVKLDGFKISWYGKVNEESDWHLIARDRQTQAYNFQYWGGKRGYDEVYHYLERPKGELYFGFGETSGMVMKNNKRIRMKLYDPMGYDAECSDGLYKHIPFYITRNVSTNYSFGIYYDNYCSSVIDLGTEIDNYHGPYRYFMAEGGDLDYYVIAGPRIASITKRVSWLGGKTLFPPKWSLGYSGSTMTYTDLPDAQKQLTNFLNLCKEHQIPCDSYQLSSGYTSINGKRYVFNWNKEKFPDIHGFTNLFHQHKVNICANIKPCLLVDHPLFEELAERGMFILEKDSNSPDLCQFWGDLGAYVDFSNPLSFEWWKSQVKCKLLEFGIDSTWNDNNEYEVWDGLARCRGFNSGTSIPIETIRPIQTLMMMKASFEAQTEFAPVLRPYLISRSGCLGMQRYVQTWSGDNNTEWKTIRFNNYMAMGLSLSGIYNTGHDVGGFAGCAPEPELFVRWVQNGIFYPRFTIHSYNEDLSVNTPWMHLTYLPEVLVAMRFRRKIMPYLYNLLYRASMQYEPIIKPVFYDFETTDQDSFDKNFDEFLLGNYLLVPSVLDKGVTSRVVYLPKGCNWYDYHTNEVYAGGSSVSLDCSNLSYFPLFVREGAIIPVNLSEDISFEGKNADTRGFLVYPLVNGGDTEYVCFEDDGLSAGYLSGRCAEISVKVQSSVDEVTVQLSATGDKSFISCNYDCIVANRSKKVNIQSNIN